MITAHTQLSFGLKKYCSSLKAFFRKMMYISSDFTIWWPAKSLEEIFLDFALCLNAIQVTEVQYNPYNLCTVQSKHSHKTQPIQFEHNRIVKLVHTRKNISVWQKYITTAASFLIVSRSIV